MVQTRRRKSSNHDTSYQAEHHLSVNEFLSSRRAKARRSRPFSVNRLPELLQPPAIGPLQVCCSPAAEYLGKWANIWANQAFLCKMCNFLGKAGVPHPCPALFAGQGGDFDFSSIARTARSRSPPCRNKRDKDGVPSPARFAICGS